MVASDLNLAAIVADQFAGWSPQMLDQLQRMFATNQFMPFVDALARVGNCAHPIRLRGSSMRIDPATGEILSSYASSDAPLGVTYIRCGNRRASVCPACSRVYAADMFHLIRAGVVGGKTVPESVAENPLVFATLTAPSFGHVHSTQACGRPHGSTRRCKHGRPLSCLVRHGDDDPELGQPLCVDCYDYTSQVVWQWWAPDLWRRFTIALRRLIAKTLGVPGPPCARGGDRAVRQGGRVPAPRRRPLPRPDPPRRTPHTGRVRRRAGPDRQPAPRPHRPGRRPAGAADRARRRPGRPRPDPGVRAAARRPTRPSRPPLRRPHRTAASRSRSPATWRSTPPSPPTTPDPAAPPTDSGSAPPSATSPNAPASPTSRLTTAPTDYLLLGKWVDMLGFRGHFASKSHRYAITLGALRRARRRASALIAETRESGRPLDLAALEADLLADADDDTTLIIGRWSYAGAGWDNDAEQALALSAAARAREYANRQPRTDPLSCWPKLRD